MDRAELISNSRRIIVKIGTNVLVQDGTLDVQVLNGLARQMHNVYHRENRQLLLVTSGAVGMGASILKLHPPIRDIAQRQACAAVGQPHLMHLYHKAFWRYRQPVGQVLLTRSVLSSRHKSTNLRNAVSALFDDGVIPICNENDSVAIAELDQDIGDNDLLGALLAKTIHADLYIILTDVRALYDANPNSTASARPIRRIEKIDKSTLAQSDSTRRGHSTGGMRSKLAAIKFAQRVGCHAVIAGGREKDIVEHIIAGNEHGTFFPSPAHRRRRA